MAESTDRIDEVIRSLSKRITVLRARNEINVSMRIDHEIAYLEELLRIARGDAPVKEYSIFESITGSCTLTYEVNGQQISAGSKVLDYGDVLKITATPASGYTLQSLTVNGNDFVSGSTITVTSDIRVNAIAVAGGEGFTIVNNSINTVEIYYEVDKEERGNTFVYGGSTETISINAEYPYYIRYESGGSTNTHTFTGTYQGTTETNLQVGYYDANIQPPNAVGSNTEWSFYSGDNGTLTISAPSGTYLHIDNTYGDSTITVRYYNADKDSWPSIAEVQSGSNETIEYRDGKEHQLSFVNEIYQPCLFSGIVQGNNYINASCADGGNGEILAPDGRSWIFTGTCYLTVEQSQSGSTITYDGTNEVTYGNDANNPIDYTQN